MPKKIWIVGGAIVLVVLLGVGALVYTNLHKSNSAYQTTSVNDEYLTFSSPQLSGFTFDFDTAVWQTPQLADVVANHGYQLLITSIKDSSTHLLVTFNPVASPAIPDAASDTTTCYTSDEISHVGATWNRVTDPNTKAISYRQDGVEIFDFDSNKRVGTPAETSCNRDNLVKLSKDLGSSEVNTSNAYYATDGVNVPLAFSVQLQTNNPSEFAPLTDTLIATLKY